MPAFSQARLKRRRAASKYSFSRTRTLGIKPQNLELTGIFAARERDKGRDSKERRAKRQSSSGPTADELMQVLAIESSCDESAVAVLDSERGLLAHELFSQIELHRIYGGVVPELAARDHVRRLLPLVRSALE